MVVRATPFQPCKRASNTLIVVRYREVQCMRLVVCNILRTHYSCSEVLLGLLFFKPIGKKVEQSNQVGNSCCG